MNLSVVIKCIMYEVTNGKMPVARKYEFIEDESACRYAFNSNFRLEQMSR